MRLLTTCPLIAAAALGFLGFFFGTFGHPIRGLKLAPHILMDVVSEHFKRPSGVLGVVVDWLLGA